MAVSGVTPSLANLFEIRTKLKNAVTAQKLLSRKVVAIESVLKNITNELLSCNEIVDEVSKSAFIKLSEARYVNEEFATHVMENIPNEACVCVTTESSALVKMVKMIVYHDDGPKPYPYLGIAKGGAQIKKASEQFKDLLKLLVKQIYLRNAFLLLDKEKKYTRKRINVINKLIIPRFESTASYILTMLDDMEREDMFRIKKIKIKKLQKNDANNFNKVRPNNVNNENEKNIFVTVCQNIEISTDNASGVTCIFILFFAVLYQILQPYI